MRRSQMNHLMKLIILLSFAGLLLVYCNKYINCTLIKEKSDLHNQRVNDNVWLSAKLPRKTVKKPVGLRSIQSSFSKSSSNDYMMNNKPADHLAGLRVFSKKLRNFRDKAFLNELINRTTASTNNNDMEVFNLEKRRRDFNKEKLAFMVSPLSDQIIEVGEDGLQGSSSSSNRVITKNYIDNGQIPSSRSKDLLTKSSSGSKFMKGLDELCRTIRSTIELTKDDFVIVNAKNQQPTMKVQRTCKGLAQVNRCEGSCSSSVQPSLKSLSGFKKDCFCCNEGSFKKIQVRLNECYLFENGSPASNRIDKNEDELNSFMDVEIEEPSECKCRRCDTSTI